MYSLKTTKFAGWRVVLPGPCKRRLVIRASKGGSSSVTDPADLLRELNSSSSWLLDEEASGSWGMEGIAKHAKSRTEKEGLRVQEDAPGRTGRRNARAGNSIYSNRQRQTSKPVITDEPSTSSSSSDAATQSRKVGIAARAGGNVQHSRRLKEQHPGLQDETVVLEPSTSRDGSSTALQSAGIESAGVVKLDRVYMNRNKEVVAALRQSGLKVEVVDENAEVEDDDDPDEYPGDEDDGDGFGTMLGMDDAAYGILPEEPEDEDDWYGSGSASVLAEINGGSSGSSDRIDTSSNSSLGSISTGRNNSSTRDNNASNRSSSGSGSMSTSNTDSNGFDSNSSNSNSMGIGSRGDSSSSSIADSSSRTSDVSSSSSGSRSRSSDLSKVGHASSISTSNSGSGGGGSSSGTNDSSGKSTSVSKSDLYKQLNAAGFDFATSEDGNLVLQRRVQSRSTKQLQITGTVATQTSSNPRSAPASTSSSALPLDIKLPKRGKKTGPPEWVLPNDIVAGLPGSPALTRAGREAVASEYRVEVTPQATRHALSQLSTPEQVVDAVSLMFPAWAANNYHLVQASTGSQVIAPSPADAAHALSALAHTCLRARLSVPLRTELARSGPVAGLVEALRVTPPRLLPESEGELSQQLYSAAQQYWLEGNADRIGEPKPEKVKVSTTSSPASTASVAADYQKLLNKYVAVNRGAGGSVSRERVTAALAVIGNYRAEDEQERLHVRDRLKHEAFVAAIWACAVLGGPALFATEMEALLRLSCLAKWRLSGGEIVRVGWALALCRHWSPRLADLETSALKAGGLSRLMPGLQTTLLWAFASLGYTPERLLLTLRGDWEWSVPSPRVRHRKAPAAKKGDLYSFTAEQLASAAWSLAVMGAVNAAPFRSLWEHVMKLKPEQTARLNAPSLTQIWQAHMAVKLEASWQPTPPGPAGKALLKRAEATAIAQGGRLGGRSQSSYQRAIANVLTRQRLMHLIEDSSTGYSVDVSVPALRLAIEADGPTHCSRTPPHTVLGSTVIKRRHLKLLGWTVLNVSYREWDALPGEVARETFIKAKLGEAAAARVTAAKA